MPEIRLTLNNGRDVTLSLPQPGVARSAFLVSLPKAGSTLFYRLMTPIANRAGLPFFSLPNTLHDLGIPTREIGTGLADVYRPTGYTFGGYRGIEAEMALPPYADGRLVVLVRDPRDMLTSLYFSEAKSHVAPGNKMGDSLRRQFEERRRRALAASIDEFALGRAGAIRYSYETVLRAIAGKAHKLFRYEDVIFDKHRWMQETNGYLGFDVPDAFVASIVEKNDIRPVDEDEDQHIRRVSPGDHLDKLTPETIAELDRIFANVLGELGYSSGQPQPAQSGPAAAADKPTLSPPAQAPSASEPPPGAPLRAPAKGSETSEEQAERIRAERRAERVAERVAERRKARER